MAGGEFSLGPWKWDATMGSVAITYESSGELKHVKAQGKDDPRDTWLGRNTGKVEIVISWKQDRDPDPTSLDGRGPKASGVHDMLLDIDPRGPKGGKPFAWVEDDADVSLVTDVIIETIKRVNTPGTQLRTATIKASTWVKPKPSTVTATPTTALPWDPGPQHEVISKTRVLPGFAATPPTVTP